MDAQDRPPRARPPRTRSPRPDTVPAEIPAMDAAAPPVSPAGRPEMIIVTGMSGAGRSRAAMALEDLDWYVVDNIPPQLLPALAGMMTTVGAGVHRLAAVVDVRSREFFASFMTYLRQVRESGTDVRLLFLDASDAALVRRFESNRRPHPLGTTSVLEGITKERTLLGGLRSMADTVIDTSDLSVHVLDVRFIPNPYWVTELRHLTGRDAPVADYVFAQDGAAAFVDAYADLLAPALPRYLDELKPYVTLAVGCTGGRHRSVASAERIAARLRARGLDVVVQHRDLGRQ